MKAMDDFRTRVRYALTGPVASLRTPFSRDGTIDHDGLRSLIDFVIDGGSKAAVLTAGDSHLIALSDAEIAEATRTMVEHVRGRALTVVADRYYHTRQAVEFAAYARDLGADVVMAMPPDWAASTTPESLAEHYGAMGQVLPVMLVTNVYIPRGMEFGLATLQCVLDGGHNVVAVKDDFCGEFARKMGLLCHDRLALWAGGQKQNHLNAHPYGCDGYLSTYLSFKPEVAHRYWAAIQAGDLGAATAIIRDFDQPFFTYIRSVRGGFDAAIHGVLELVGICQRWRPAPYCSLTDEEMDSLSGFLQDLSVL